MHTDAAYRTEAQKQARGNAVEQEELTTHLIKLAALAVAFCLGAVVVLAVLKWSFSYLFRTG
jgi:hypothetical protein